MCYKDITYCDNDCTDTKCEMRITAKVIADARKWWGKPGAPIAVADFAPNCKRYKPCNTH